MRLSIVRLDLRGAAQAIGGLLEPPAVHCKYTQIEMDFGVAWIDGQRALVALDGFRAATQAVKCIGHRDERICEVRPEADRGPVVPQCKLELASATIQVAQVEVGR